MQETMRQAASRRSKESTEQCAHHQRTKSRLEEAGRWKAADRTEYSGNRARSRQPLRDSDNHLIQMKLISKNQTMKMKHKRGKQFRRKGPSNATQRIAENLSGRRKKTLSKLVFTPSRSGLETCLSCPTGESKISRRFSLYHSRGQGA